MPIERDDEIRALLAECRAVAILGIKDGERDDAFRVPRYLKAAGYAIHPVNPKLERVLDQPCVATLADVSGPIDLVDVFRAPAHLEAHANEILALDPAPRAVWLQLAIRQPLAERRLEERGIAVVADRCLMVEHARLLGRARAE